MGRIPFWRIAEQGNVWLDAGADLVVFEFGRIRPPIPRAALSCTLPAWVSQVLVISDNAGYESLLSGNRVASARYRLNKAKRAGFQGRFSQSTEDFDYFYHRMYVPFVKSRHGERALITPYDDQRKRWFPRGGLIIACREDRPVAGALCHAAGDRCYYVEEGVLEGDPRLLSQEVIAVLFGSALRWACERKMKYLDLGGTRPWCSRGSFDYKQGWGAQVQKRRRTHNYLTFVSKGLKPSLQEHLNRLGLISEIGGKYYLVHLGNGSCLPETQAQCLTASARKHGLAGVLAIEAGSSALLNEVQNESASGRNRIRQATIP